MVLLWDRTTFGSEIAENRFVSILLYLCWRLRAVSLLLLLICIELSQQVSADHISAAKIKGFWIVLRLDSEKKELEFNIYIILSGIKNIQE